MGKRFGRNKKRKLLEDIKSLERKVVLIENQRDSAINIPYVQNESMCLAITPDDIGFYSGCRQGEIKVVRLRIDPMSMMFSKKIRKCDLEVWKKYPQNLSSEFASKIEAELNKVIPIMLREV